MDAKIKDIPSINDRIITAEDFSQISLEPNLVRKYILVHHYDVGDCSVHFSGGGLTIQEVKDLAVYIQFKAENLLGDSVSLENITIAQFLEMHGAKIIDQCVLSKDNFNPVGMILIDIYDERESRICGNSWYSDHYDSFDTKFGEVAASFLLEKSKGKNLDGTLI